MLRSVRRLATGSAGWQCDHLRLAEECCWFRHTSIVFLVLLESVVWFAEAVALKGKFRGRVSNRSQEFHHASPKADSAPLLLSSSSPLRAPYRMLVTFSPPESGDVAGMYVQPAQRFLLRKAVVLAILRQPKKTSQQQPPVGKDEKYDEAKRCSISAVVWLGALPTNTSMM